VPAKHCALTGAIAPQASQFTSPQPQWPSNRASANASTAGTLLKDAGGAYLSVTNQNIEDNLSALAPGDLLYVMGDYPLSSTQSTTVTHVILWTGRTVSELGVEKIVAPWQPYAHPDDWVIVDSHFAGPDYRPVHGPFEIEVPSLGAPPGMAALPG